MAGIVRKVLILAPLRVARSTWTDEANRWACFAHLRLSVIVGDPEQRAAALAVPADIYTLNYENVPWLVDQMGDGFDFDMIVADESVKLKNLRSKQGGARAGALRDLAHTKVKRWVNLTGMAVENGLRDLWGQLWFIDAGQRLGRTFDAFESRWFMYKRKSDAFKHDRAVEMVVMPHAQSEMQAAIKDVCLTLDPKDWFKLDAPIVNTLYVDLPPAARKNYREMERAFFTKIKNHEIETFSAAGKSQKLLQFCNGAAYLDPSVENEDDPKARAWVEVHEEKIQALESVVNEAGGMPILVAYHFKSDLARLKKAFPQGRHISKKTDEDDFKAGKIPVAFVHPQSIGHGVDGFQHVTNIIVFFGFWWGAGPYLQVIERIGPMRQMQAGLKRPCFVHHIAARDTIDEDVIECLNSKRSVSDILIEALKRRNSDG